MGKQKVPEKNFLFLVFWEKLPNETEQRKDVVIISGPTPEAAIASVKKDMLGPRDICRLLDEVDMSKHDARFYQIHPRDIDVS
ncbi:MAG TPA: hypothetical protein VHA30_01460 [Patescibacteria group bacterium]|nr:hypothetical protein [Patescibacteria group bacterium]